MIIDQAELVKRFRHIDPNEGENLLKAFAMAAMDYVAEQQRKDESQPAPGDETSMKETPVTPTEDLIMEVLAARYRLGEHLWTMDTKHGKAIKSLADKGLLTFDSGVMYHTYKVWLTEKGKAEFLDPGYHPPLVRNLADQIHRAIKWQYDECDHGTYSGGANHGMPYKMCEIFAQKIAREWSQ